MNVTSYPVFLKYFNALDEVTQQEVKKAIKEMQKAESLHKITSVKKIVDSGDKYFRKRVGKYRLLFRWNKATQEIYLYKIDQRKDIYK
jgi:mRNA-degrading endonuclease RelE of RelBE toxin-antitoxin system